jgi:hypothetical protein
MPTKQISRHFYEDHDINAADLGFLEAILADPGNNQ